MKTYNVRTWLNKKSSASTGSLVCYYGPAHWDTNSVDMFVELASCHDKARLHKTQADTEAQYLAKIKKLRNELDLYIQHLETQIS